MVLLRNEEEELNEESLLLFPELLELLQDLEEKGLILVVPPPLLLLSLKANGSELFLLSDEAETPFPGRCQFWSLNQFFSVGFLQPKIVVKKCVL